MACEHTILFSKRSANNTTEHGQTGGLQTTQQKMVKLVACKQHNRKWSNWWPANNTTEHGQTGGLQTTQYGSARGLQLTHNMALTLI
jgi:hypothetical protein